MKLFCKTNLKKLSAFVFALMLIVSTMFIGMQYVNADAYSSGVIQLSVYARHGGDSSSSGDIGLGHAWLVIENGTTSTYDFCNTTISAGETVSIGTWGNIKDPDTNKKHKGIWFNLEAYKQWGSSETASLTITITSSQLHTLNNKCLELDQWDIWKNCAYFASNVWNCVAPSNMQVNSWHVVSNYPETLKDSIKGISGYRLNRSFAYNDRSGYCPNSTSFKSINASRITIPGSSSSSSSAVDYQTSFPEEYNTVEKIGAYAIEQKSSYQYVQ